MGSSQVSKGFFLGVFGLVAAFAGRLQADTITPPDLRDSVTSVTYTYDSSKGEGILDIVGVTGMITLPSGSPLVVGGGSFEVKALFDSSGHALTAALLNTYGSNPWLESGTIGSVGLDVVGNPSYRNPNFVSYTLGSTGAVPVFHFDFLQDGFAHNGTGASYIPPTGSLIAVNIPTPAIWTGPGKTGTNISSTFSASSFGANFYSYGSSTADAGTAAPLPGSFAGGGLLFALVFTVAIVDRSWRVVRTARQAA